MQEKLIGVLVVVGLVIGAFFFGRMTGVDSVKAKQTASAQKVIDTRAEAEKVIVQDRIVYRDRIQKIREVVTDCKLPDDLIGLLRESGVFSR